MYFNIIEMILALLGRQINKLSFFFYFSELEIEHSSFIKFFVKGF